MHATDSFEHQLRNLAKTMREDLLNRADEQHRECTVCGVAELEVEGLPPHGRVEFYNVPCPADECEGNARGLKYIVETPPELPIDKQRLDGWRCTEPDCSEIQSLAANAMHDHSPYRIKEYHLPTTALVKSRILKHHTSYEPEKVIDVCYTCHGLIHSDNETYADLEPAVKRGDADI